MKISRTGVFVSLLASFLLASCASPPALPAGGGNAAPAATASLVDPVPEAAPAAESVPVPETAPPEPAAEIPAEPAAETVPVPEAIDSEPTEIPLPEPVEAVPPLPPGERILYFYPEPEALFVPPAETAPAPVKTVPEKPAPAKAAAPKAAVPPAVPAAAVPAVPPKAESAPVEKPADAVLPGIWVGESSPVAAAERIPPVPPSRTASMEVGQTLEVWYPGSGWVYLGDSSAQNGLAYETRKLDKTDTLFTFKALKGGNYILDFSRFDLLEDAFSSDSLAVEVSGSSSKRSEKIRAPNYRSGGAVSTSPGAVPGAAQPAAATQNTSAAMTDEPALASFGPAPATAPASGSGPGAKTATAAATAPKAAGTASSAIDAEAALAQAKKALAANDPASALGQLDLFFTAAVSSLDEGWFLRGQAYEANGAVRDIRKALAAYETLVSAYPESARWKEADARIRYIKQFYLRIR